MKLTNEETIGAQEALSKLMGVGLPIMVSLDIAIISKMVDERVKTFSLVRTPLYKKYSIKTEPGDVEGTIRFMSTVKGDTEEETKKLQQENLEAFGDKFNELLQAKAEEFVFNKIKLPKEIDGKPLIIKPEILKAITGFIEVE